MQLLGLSLFIVQFATLSGFYNYGLNDPWHNQDDLKILPFLLRDVADDFDPLYSVARPHQPI